MVARQWDFHWYYAMQEHFASWGPPDHVAAGIAVGFKVKPKAKAEPEVSFEDFMAAIAPGGSG